MFLYHTFVTGNNRFFNITALLVILTISVRRTIFQTASDQYQMIQTGFDQMKATIKQGQTGNKERK